MRRGAWVAASVLLAAGLGWLGWLAWQQGRPAAQAAVVAPQAVAALAPAAVGPGVAPSVAAHEAGAPQAQAPKSEFVEVCGFGSVKRSELESPPVIFKSALLQAFEHHAKQAPVDVQARLNAGPLLHRVAAAVLRGDTQAAALQAASASDAPAYRLALAACRRDAAARRDKALGIHADEPPDSPLWVSPEVPSACASLSVDRLEALDRDDAWPWMLRLADSQRRRDQPGVAQALHQLAHRSRQSPPAQMLTAAVLEVVGTKPSIGEAMMLSDARTREVLMAGGDGFLAVTNACYGKSLRDANRRQLCEQVARKLPDLVGSLSDASILHSMEARLDLPHSPQSVSREEMKALTRVQWDTLGWMAEPTCDNVARIAQQSAAVVRDGELAYARAQLKQPAASAPR